MTPRKLISVIPIITLLNLFVMPGPLHAQDGPDTHVVIVTKDDNGQTINLEQGNILRLELSANPTTGYDWMPDPANWASTIASTVAVIGVLPGSPAEAAGLVPGDFIRTINGDPEVSGATFNDQLETLAGTDVTLGILHNFTPKDVTLTADQFPAGDTAFIYVAEVAPGTPAEQAGFLPEDVIQAVDGTPITSTKQLVDMVQLHADQAMTVTVGRPLTPFDIIVTPTADDTGTVRLGLAVQELTPSIIGATVGDFDIKQEVGLVDESSGSAAQTLILKLLDLEPEFTPDTPDAAGSGGTDVIRFLAVAPGETTLRLNYAATYENNPEPSDTFEIHVVITGNGGGGDSEAAQTLTGSDNGKAITLSAGDTLRLELEANATTGYSWVLDEALDQLVLEQVGEADYVSDPNPAPGSGGTSIWTFRAAGAGTTTLTLYYVPPGDTTPYQTFKITVKVK